jgi:hypothetical protein
MLPVKYNTKQFGAASGIEFGKELVSGGKTVWFITPRAQINAGFLSGNGFYNLKRF